MERMITRELLIHLASKALRELDRSDCSLLAVFRPPTDDDLPEMGFATLDEIAPLWCVDFLCGDLKPLIVHVRDKPGVTDSMIGNELMLSLAQYAAARV